LRQFIAACAHLPLVPTSATWIVSLSCFYTKIFRKNYLYSVQPAAAAMTVVLVLVLMIIT
jgi:hypothetical protein